MALNWNDARYLLATARSGTVAAAARVTGVDATTVARRIAAIERVLGSRLFERVGGRLVPTAAGQAVVRHAAEAERALREIEAVRGPGDAEPSGTVRISAVGSLLSGFLIPRLPDFARRYPAIVPELIADTAHADLIQREADIALRMVRPATGSLVVKRLTRVAYAAYATDALLGGGRPRTLEQLPWVIYEQRFEHLPEARWRRKHVPGARTIARTTVGAPVFDAVVAGLGAAMLPCYRADGMPGLRRLSEPVPLREIWLVVDRQQRRLPGVRAAYAWLSEVFEQERALFAAGRT